ncbi:MAG: adenylate kinase [Chloroflexi bacterium]|nr:adenylate kinase [Chloroflexota bacterium]
MKDIFHPSSLILHPSGKRIVVVGATGSGKTTLAREIARRLDYPHIETDALHWEPNWTEAPREIFRARVDAALRGDCWVIDGNYGKVRDLVWARADTLVWMDYALPVIFWRLGWRTLKRIVTRETLWGNNREGWRAVFGRDSLFLWALSSRPRHRRDYPALLQQPEYAHLKLIHLHSPRATDEWLARFDPRVVS